jgi:hypothetical protein
MLYANTYNFNLTGTNFGKLSNYPKTEYVNSYLFSDLFGNPNINYTANLSGNIFLSAATTREISAMPGLEVWLDVSDSSKVLMSTTGITGLLDKSPNNRRFFTNQPIERIVWSRKTGWVNNKNTESGFYSLSNFAARVFRTNFFYNSTFSISLSSPFTLIFVWRENVVLDILDEQNIFDEYIPTGDVYPLCIRSDYDQVTGEIVLINNYETNRSFWGFRDSTYGILLTGTPFYSLSENYFVWTHRGDEPLSLSTQKLEVFNTQLTASDFYYISGGPATKTPATTIGSLCGSDYNDFIFGEMLLFSRVVSGDELIRIKNSINNKWNFDYKEENVIFGEILSGGPLRNISYDDYSLLTSNVEIPIQSCVTLLSINLSSFDTSVSKISKIVYEFKDKTYEVSSGIVLSGNIATPFLNNYNLDIELFPDKSNFVSTYNIKLSVFRFDATVNRFVLSGSILKCNILDYFSKSKLLDSQILDNSKEVLIMTENYDKNILFVNKLNVFLPPQALSGGDVESLVNNDVISPDDDVILLSDLLEDQETSKEVFKVPIIPPLPRPRINPILPS